MKGKYSKPYTEIEEFKAVDILTASGELPTGGDIGDDDNVVDGSDGW